MAYKMKLNVPHEGMPFIWNISNHVGILAENPNQRDDVELVQRLIIEIYKVSPPKKPNAGSIGSLSAASGQVDAQTAFQIYRVGDPEKPLLEARQISPARNGAIWYAASSMWTIAWLNYKLRKHAPQTWAEIPNMCSPSLKQALLTKVSP